MPEFGHARQLLLVGMILALPLALAHAEAPKIAPASLPRIGTIDQQFQSYNVEMVGVTGGNFWKPYGEKPLRPPEVGPARAALDLYAYRPPTDLTNARLRRLAAALAPAYLRVSGTWSNATYSGFGRRTARASCWIRWRPDPSAVVRRHRFCQSCRCADCDIVRHKPRHARRDRRLDTGAGAQPARLYQVTRRQHRSCRVHERARPCFRRRQGKGL